MKLFITYSLFSALFSWLTPVGQPAQVVVSGSPAKEPLTTELKRPDGTYYRVLDWTLGGMVYVKPAARPLVAPTLSATKVDELFTDTGVTGFSPGDVIRYTIVISNTGNMDATGVLFNDVIDANTTLVPGSLETSPVAVNDSYSSLGNVGITVPVGSGLLINDFDIDNAPNPLTVTAVNTAGTQGQVTFNANGSFTFMPNAGFEGTTTFTYTVTDGTFNSTGTVTVTVNEVIWFIDNNAGVNGDGRLGTPFNSLPNFFPGAADDPGDIIFLYRNTATNYTGPLTLQSTQALIGAGASQSIVAITGITVPSFSNALPATGGANLPVIALASASNNVTLGPANKVHGVQINSTVAGGTALIGSSVGNLKVREVVVSHTNGTAVNINGGGALDVIFRSVSSSNATTGITVQNTTGSFEITGSGGTDGSGGTISNITSRGAQFSSASNIMLSNMTFTNANTVDGGVCGAADNSGCNGAIHLNSVTNVDLDNIDINGTTEQGVNLRNTSGFTMNNCTLINCGVASGGGDTEESCLYAVNMSGTGSITGSSLTFASERAAVIYNTNQTLTLSVSGSTFGQTQAMTLGADAFEFDGLGSSNSTLDFSSCTFTTPKTNGLQVISDNTAQTSVDVTTSTFNPGSGGAAAIDFVSNATATLNFNIDGNSSIQSRSINCVNISGNGNSTFQGRINNNTVAIASGGTGSGIGIRVIANADSDGKVEIHNNNVTSNLDPGIYAQAVGGTGRLDAKVTNNTVAIGTGGSYYIDCIAGASSSLLTNKACANVANNTTGAISGTIIANWRARSATASHELLLQGTGATATAVWNANSNTPAAPPGIVNQSGGGVFTFGATCLLPTNPPLFISDPVDALVQVDSSQASDGGTEMTEAGDDAAKSSGNSSNKTAPDNGAEASTAPSNSTPVETFMSGETVTTGPFTLPANQNITLRFRVTIDNPFPQFDCSVSNQATISGSNFTSVLTDDPDVGGSANPTVSQFPPLSLGNLVYKDNNKNGVFDAGDAGVNGVLVRLYADNGDGVLTGADGAAISTATTAGGGLYSFTNLCPGDYIVEVAASNFNVGGPLYDNALSSALLSSPIGGAPDPDNDVDNDDNGDQVSGFGVASAAITLALGTEPITDGDADNNTNLSLDFGFKTPTSVTINDVTMNEGTGGGPTSFSFTVTRTDNVEAFNLTVNTADGTATTADNDYTAISGGTVAFTAGGSLTATVTVLVNQDNKVENNETFTVVLSGAPSGVLLTDPSGLGTITNDDAAVVTLTSTTATLNEGNSPSPTTDFYFKATLNNPVQGGFTIAYANNDGTATLVDGDYNNNDGTITFAGTAGENHDIVVQGLGDVKVELNETFTVTLGAITGAPAGVTTAGSPQTGTILNDDAATVALAGNVSQAENLTPQVFTVTLSNPVDAAVTVLFNTSNGTATTADNDYTGIVNQTVTFAANSTTAQVVNVTIVNDNKVEANEVYNVALGTLNASGRNVSLGSSTGTGTIVNDDAATVTLSGGGSANEGNSGTTPRVFTATLNNPVQGGFSVPYTTNDGTATTADNDYVDNDGPALVFAGTAGEAKTITVLVNGDSKVEANETFTVALGAITGAPAGVTTAGSPQTGTITNDELDWGDGPDSLPTILFYNGARHATVLGFQLGAAIDGDPDGQSTGGTHNNLANGDDTDADGDDEDGVTLPSVFVAGTTATVTVNASQAGKLDGFMDFNWNRQLSDAGEKIFNNVSLVAGDNVLTFSVPANAVVGSSFLRFRFSSAGGLSNSGLAADGEVEDYRTNIVSNQFSIDNPSVAEGNAGTSNLVYTVTRTTNNTASSVDYAITGGTATSGSDYAPLAAGTLNFTAGGAFSQTITVTVNGDLVVEDNETVIITLSNPVNGGIGANPGTGTITNDDAANLTLSGGSAQNEGNAGTTSYTFTATLSAAVQGGFTVPYTTNDGTATTADADYQDNDGTLTFAGTAGETKTITVLVNGDNKVELNETFTENLGAIGATSAVQAAAITKVGSPQTGTITNDDAATVALAANISQLEAVTPQTFSVTLSNPVDVAVTVLFNTSDGTATTADNDYNGITNQTVTFAAGTTTAQSVPVTINNDTKVEADELYNVAIGTLNAGGRNVSLGTSSRTGTILNDDASVVTLSGGIAQNEGNAGTTSYVFTATLSNAVQGGFTVPYTTNDGTATTADADYQDNDGSLTFTGTAGETKTFTVLVNGDVKVELNETFTTALGAISGAPAGVTTAGSPQTATITNDDAATVSIAANISQLESVTPQTFSVTLSNPVDVAVTVLFNTSDGTATTADNDYNGITNQTVTFAAGTTTAQSVPVTINNDAKVEADEVYNVAISSLNASGRNVSLGTSSRTGTILNDDAATLTLSGGIAQNEGNAGTTSYTFTVTLSAAVQGGFTVPYTTNDGTATTADADYQDNDGTLTFAGTAGETKTFTVLVNGDTKVELNETFTGALGAISGAPAGVTLAGSPQTGTITNDDAATVALAANISQLEAVTPQTFSVTLSNPVDVAVTVLFNTSNGTATTADNDYNGITNQTVTFAAGTTTAQSVPVTINNDAKVEADEVYNVAIGTLNASGRNVSLGTSTRTGTILNDDNATVTLSGGIAQNEGNAGNTPYIFTATLNNAVQGGLTANYLTNDGTATTADADYTDNDGSLVFAGTAGETKTFTVNVISDHKVEANETFQTVLTSLVLPSGITTVTILGSPQTATITNDEIDFGDAPDTYATLLASNGARHATVLGFLLGAAIDGEDDGQPNASASGDGADEDGVTLPNPLVTNTTANVTVNASASGKIDAWVDFNNNGSFADAGEKVFNNVSVVAGNNSLSFAVPNGAVPSTTFARFRLSTAGGLSFNGPAADGEVEDYQVTIVNTQFSINDPSVNEGNAGTTNLAFVITRSNNASACSINYAITGGTATTADNDYQVLAAGTASFTAGGALTQTVNVVVNGDVKVELNETVDMTLSNPVNGSILDGSGTGTIVNDDAAVITITNATVTEGDTPNTISATFTINMSNPSDANVAVNYNTVDNTATIANNDYQTASGTHTFTPGQTSKTVAVTVVGDCAIEANETYFLRLSGLVNNGRNVSLSGGGATLDGTGTINNDDALPVITCPANITVNAAPGVCNATVTLPLPTTSSVCGTSVLEYHYRTVDANNVPTGAYNAFAPSGSNVVNFAVGRYEVEWRITDGSGASSCSFFLRVIDNQPPVISCPANQNIPANASCMGVVGSWSPTFLSDNCSPAPTVVQTPAPSTALIGHNDSEVVTLTATDVNGNTASCSFTVTLKDVTPPVAKCKNATINLGSNGTVTVAPSAVDNVSTDNCGLSLMLTPNTFTCANIGHNTVTLKATDAGGNMSTCTAIVTIKDLTPPTALCKNINVFLDENGHASIGPAAVNNNSYDACGIATMTINYGEFDCGQIGGSPVVVQLTLKDVNNNTSSCLANVYVKDAIAPTAVCDNTTVSLSASGYATVQTAPLAANSTDNCSVTSYSPVAKVYTSANLGLNNLSITVKDWSNNAATCVSQVTVLPYGSSLPGPDSGDQYATADQPEALNGTEEMDLSVFPNPTPGQSTVMFRLPEDQVYHLRLFDLNGRLIVDMDFEGQAGDNSVVLELGELSAGVYLIDVQSAAMHGRKKLVLQR